MVVYTRTLQYLILIIQFYTSIYSKSIEFVCEVCRKKSFFKYNIQNISTQNISTQNISRKHLTLLKELLLICQENIWLTNFIYVRNAALLLIFVHYFLASHLMNWWHLVYQIWYIKLNSGRHLFRNSVNWIIGNTFLKKRLDIADLYIQPEYWISISVVIYITIVILELF